MYDKFILNQMPDKFLHNMATWLMQNTQFNLFLSEKDSVLLSPCYT